MPLVFAGCCNVNFRKVAVVATLTHKVPEDQNTHGYKNCKIAMSHLESCRIDCIKGNHMFFFFFEEVLIKEIFL